MQPTHLYSDPAPDKPQKIQGRIPRLWFTEQFTCTRCNMLRDGSEFRAEYAIGPQGRTPRRRLVCRNCTYSLRDSYPQRQILALPDTSPPFDRFWPNVDRSGGKDACWPWTGFRKKDKRGNLSYGRIYIPGLQTYSTHRFALELRLGRPIKPGFFALHHCDNPPCCNPAHLYEGTPKQNVHDTVMRQGRFRGQPAVGVKLNEVTVLAIRTDFHDGQTVTSLAAAHSIAPTTVRNVIAGLTWKHVSGPLREVAL